MRRAEWRMRADDPKTMLGWWWRGFVRGGLPVDIAIAIPILISLVLWNDFTPWLYAAAVLAKIIVGGFRAYWSPDELKPLLPEPAPREQFRALVAYR